VASVSTIAVIGAGASGRGIAHAAALAGYRAILEDLLPNALRRAESEVRENFNQAILAGRVSAGEARSAMDRMQYADSVEEAARNAEFVIETLPEDLESKIEIFTLLDKVCRPGTILVSNARTLSIAEIAGMTYRPEKCIGMRFLPTVWEIVRTVKTDNDTVAAAVDICTRMNKEVVVNMELSSGLQ
jgi:3-hydroxyacyl-CoA dehydrogenase